MKNLLISLFSCITLIGFSQHDISTDLLGISFSRYNIGYEYAINTNNSVGLNVGFGNSVPLQKSKNEFGNISYSDVNIIPEYKYFMTPNKGNDGIYFGAYGRYRSSKANGVIFTESTNPFTEEKTDVETKAMAIGLLTGYKWQSSGKVFFEITGGIGTFIIDELNTSNALINDENSTTFKKELSTPYGADKNLPDFRLMIKIGLRLGN